MHHLQTNTRFLSLVLIGLTLVVLCVFPDADYPWWKDLSDVHDEFWWAENARRKLLFDQWFWDGYAAGLASGPLSTIWHFLILKTFGLNFWSLRLVALTPAVLSAICLILFKPINQRIKPEIILLLVSSSSYFTFSRIGFLEMMLFFISINYLILQSSNKNLQNLLAGVLLTLGLLFKGSFIYLFIPLLIFTLISSKSQKQKLTILLSAASTAFAAYLFYYYPNEELFSKYVKYFNIENLKLIDLLNPLGWIARLAWLPYKETFSHPFAFLTIALVLLKICSGKTPGFKNTFWGLIILILVGTLISDFSDRRLIFILFFLPFCLTEKFDRPLNTPGVFLISIVLCLPLITLVIDGQFEPAGLIKATLFPFALLCLLNYLIIILLKRFFKAGWKKTMLTFSSAVWLIFVLINSAKTWQGFLESDQYLIVIILSVLCALIIIMTFKTKSNEQLKPVTPLSVSLIQLIFLSFTQLSPQFTLKQEALMLNELTVESTDIYATNTSLGICFLSNAKIPFDLKNINLNNEFSFTLEIRNSSEADFEKSSRYSKVIRESELFIQNRKKPTKIKIRELNSISYE